MWYLKKEANPSGAFPAPQSNSFADSVEITDEQLKTFLEYNGFVTITETEDGVVLEPNTELWNEWKASQPTPPDPLDKAKESKLEEVDNVCNATIIAGCDVTLSDGATGHISLTNEDQINLSTAYNAVIAGATNYPYHIDGELCKMYSADDIIIMGNAASAHKLYHTTYVNHVHTWIKRCETEEEVNAIMYGSELPEDLAENMNNVLTVAANV